MVSIEDIKNLKTYDDYTDLVLKISKEDVLKEDLHILAKWEMNFDFSADIIGKCFVELCGWDHVYKCKAEGKHSDKKLLGTLVSIANNKVFQNLVDGGTTKEKFDIISSMAMFYCMKKDLKDNHKKEFKWLLEGQWKR